MELDDKLNYLCNILSNAVSKLVTHKEVNCNIKNKWFNKKLKEMQNKKNVLNRKAIMSKKRTDMIEYLKAKSTYKTNVEKEKNQYFQKMINNVNGNTKKMWNCLNKIVNFKESSCVKDVTFNNVICKNDLEIATNFNTYFVNSIKDIHDSIPLVTYNYVPPPPIPYPEFNFRSIDVQYLHDIVKQMKNKYNKDLITTQVIKDSFDITGYFFVNIINKSLSTCIVPYLWKLSTVTPVPKVKNTTKCNEFRPINVLPIHEKLLEYTVHEQLMKYVNENEILLKTQSGFRANHSCETSLNLVLTTWKESIDRGDIVVAVFLDFKRAFETIDRNMLLKKLEHIGISKSTVHWFANYLNDRYQQTTFNGQTSCAIPNPYGVPQGSVLGPLLFILYINDIDTAIQYCKINLFADDTLLTFCSNNYKEAIDKINLDLSSLYKWLNQNLLKLNINKTKYMVIGKTIVNNTNLNVNIDNTTIERVTHFKYLGIIIDDKLKFNDHILYITKNTSRKIGALYRAGNKLTNHAKITMYNTMIRPHFMYCSTILFLCRNSDIDKLQVQQNKAMRLILKCTRETPIRDMLQKLKWLSVRQLIYFNVLLFIYKMQNNLLPKHLCKNIRYTYEQHTINTRNRNKIRLPTCKKTSTQNSLFYKGFKLYNEIPINIKQLSERKFKIKLREYVLMKHKHT